MLSAEDRQAAMEAIRQAGAKQGGRMAHRNANGKSAIAHASSLEANDAESTDAHQQAATAHRDAASAHHAAGNEDMAEHHNSLAEHHQVAHSKGKYVPSGFAKPTPNMGGIMNRKHSIEFLTTNCECWQHEGDAETLNGFSDTKLETLVKHFEEHSQAVTVANSAVGGFTDDKGRAYRVNPETGKWETRVANANAKTKTKADYADLEEEDPEDIADGGDDEEEEGEPPLKGKKAFPFKKKKEPAANSQPNRPRTADEWFRSAPTEIQNTFRYAQQIEEREKDKIIAEMLVNVAESDRQSHRERLLRRSLEDLQNDLDLVPKMPRQEDIDRATPKRVTNRGHDNSRPRITEDMLVAPVMNWNEVEQTATTNTGSSSPDVMDASDDEEYLKTAPPRIRAMIQNAVVVDARERRDLITELTANLDDEDAKRLAIRLQHKPLDELRDLKSLTPKPQPKRSAYFGGGAPVGNTRSGSNDDLLELPKIDWKNNNGV